MKFNDQADLAPETVRGLLFLILFYHPQFIVTQNGTKFSSARAENVFSVVNQPSVPWKQFELVAQTDPICTRGRRIPQEPLKYADFPHQAFEFGYSTETIKMWANGTQSIVTLVGDQRSVGPWYWAYHGPMRADGLGGRSC